MPRPTCARIGKVMFASLREARAVMRMVADRCNTPMQAFRCRFCGKFHFGSRLRKYDSTKAQQRRERDN